MPEKTLEEDHRCCKKALHPKHSAEVLQQRETVGEPVADEEEEENKKKNNKKILRTVEERVGMISVRCVGRRKRMMWTLKTGWHVKCVHSGYILSAYPPIIHTLYHMQTFIAIFVYSSNFH